MMRRSKEIHYHLAQKKYNMTKEEYKVISKAIEDFGNNLISSLDKLYVIVEESGRENINNLNKINESLK
jgi:hypothetical protein